MTDNLRYKIEPTREESCRISGQQERFSDEVRYVEGYRITGLVHDGKMLDVLIAGLKTYEDAKAIAEYMLTEGLALFAYRDYLSQRQKITELYNF